MRTLIILFIALSLVGCDNRENLKQEINQLKKTRTNIKNDIQYLNNLRSSTSKEIAKMDERLKELNIYVDGKQPRYILKVRLMQSHFTLDLEQHVKDELNAIEFELPVSKEFYNSVNVGTRIVDEFRFGSLLLYGSFGYWIVTGKQTL